MTVKRNPRAGIDDRWHKRVKQPDGTTRLERSSVYGTVTRWRVRWVDDSGTERTRVFDRKPDAQGFLNSLTADVVRGDYVSPDKSGSTFGTVAAEWFKIKEAKCKPKTLATYSGLLDVLILPRFGETPLRDLDYRTLSTWIAGLRVDGAQSGGGLSASRIRQAHQLIHAVLRYALKSGMVAKNVAADIDKRADMPAEGVRKQHHLTAEQLTALASRCGRFGTLTLVLGTCGLRFGEAAALRRKDVSDRTLNIERSATAVPGRGMVETGTKTGQDRKVAVPPPVWKRLTAELPGQSESLVFPGTSGFLTLGTYRWVFDRAVTALRAEAEAQRQREIAKTGQASTPEFPEITPHDLRHTCASLLISTGANIKVVQRQLGHKTAVLTLDRYGHLYADDLFSSADALGVVLTNCGTTAVSGGRLRRAK